MLSINDSALSVPPDPSFRRMPESSGNDRDDRVRQACVVESKVVTEGVVVVWIPVYTGMTIIS